MRRILAALILAPVASAQIVSLTGDIEEIGAPLSVQRQVYESELARIFLERAEITIPAGQTINAVNPGIYDCYCDFEDDPLAEPVLADTYFFHFDPPGTSEHFAEGEIEFDRPIVGVIGRSLTMQQTDTTLGGPETSYPTSRFNREFEFQTRGSYDYFEVSPDRRRIAFRIKCSSDVDQFRVVLEHATGCAPDCDGSGDLDLFDFLCFQNHFDAGDLRADFDGDGELTIFDFLAFQNAYQDGCA